MPRPTFIPSVRAALPHVGCAVVALALVACVSWMLGPTPALIPWWYLAAVTPWLVWIDVREHRLPNRLVLPAFAAWALGAGGVLLTSPAAWGALATSLIAGGAFALVLGALAWWGGMGGGDLKLGTVLGLTLGLVSAPAAVLALPIAFACGAAVALGVMVASPKGARRGRSIPFGPWLLLGAGAALGLARGGIAAAATGAISG